MVEETLKAMLEDIRSRNKPKDDLLNYYVQKRLNKSIKTYYKQLLDSYNFLSNVTDETKLAKKLAKL